MKKLNFLLVIIFLVNFSALFGQATENSFKELRKFYKSKALSGDKKNFRYNSAEANLEISGYNIPLMDTKFMYATINGSHLINFNCEQCIISLGSDGKLVKGDVYNIAFAKKKDCYKFIDLLNVFRESL